MFGLDLSLSLLLFGCILAALAFEFINGFHDTANAVATVIYTHSLQPRVAVIWSGIWNFIGVNVGGIAVAIGIINLLPVEALTDNNVYHSLSMVLALIITAIIWNIGTWYLGIPCSSSHTLIGSIFGVGIVYMLLPGNEDVVLNWKKIKDTGLSLLISPMIGFFVSMAVMFILKVTIRNKTIFKEPPAKKAPPLWIRSLLVLTCTSVSFSHGSNDGQKGVGLIMIILISIVPLHFAFDHTKDPVNLHTRVVKVQTLLHQADTTVLAPTDKAEYTHACERIDSLEAIFTGVTRFDSVSRTNVLAARRFILVFAKKSEGLTKSLTTSASPAVNSKWVSEFDGAVKEMKTYTEYSPWWVILMISIALGLGTMIGWKRIVVTIGEKIGKSHLTYAQGASAELVAAGTISVSSLLGLPVSTTHVLSSGVAGSMVSGNGLKNLQKKTVAAIGIAWLITVPVTVLLSGFLFLIFRLIFL
jgi:PiT family inorganic phosphate transporter